VQLSEKKLRDPKKGIESQPPPRPRAALHQVLHYCDISHRHADNMARAGRDGFAEFVKNATDFVHPGRGAE
jgi:hypothetical protein